MIRDGQAELGPDIVRLGWVEAHEVKREAESAEPQGQTMEGAGYGRRGRGRGVRRGR